MNTELQEHEPNMATGKLAGSLTVSSVDDFRAEVETWLGSHENVRVLILDLEEIDLLDSSGLGGILSLFKVMKDRDGLLKLAALSRKARMVFEITRAHDTFEIFDTAAEALEDSRRL